MRTKILFLIWLIGSQASAETTLSDFLKKAWSKSPVLTGDTSKLEESEQFVSSARGKFFPHVSLAGIDSTGFPASTGQLGVGGLMGSPFRSGLAGGVIVQQTIYDFGRISSALESAKAGKSLNEAKLAEEKFRYLSSLGGLYLGCARARSLLDKTERMMGWAELILKETLRFTKTGQRSIIDNALVKSKVNDLILQQKEYKKIEASYTEQMKHFAGIDRCDRLSQTLSTVMPQDLMVEEPSILLAKAQVEISDAGRKSAEASELPTLDVMGSAGYMNQARLVEKQDYAAGVGLIVPIWNGGEDLHRARAFKAQSEYQKDILKNTEIEFRAKLRKLLDQRQIAQETLAELETNLDQVRDTMKIASKRYQRLEGPLIDVRDAYSELLSMEIQRVNLLYSLAETSFQLNLLKTR